MSTTWIITRHPGLLEFIQEQGISGRLMTHLDLTRLSPGDRVIGTLPVNRIAELNQAGVTYWHLCLKLTLADRGRELSAARLRQLNAHLQAFNVTAGEHYGLFQ